MLYKVLISPEAQKNLKKIPFRDQNRIKMVIASLAAFGLFPPSTLDVKKLEGEKNIYRIRSGSYRIILIEKDGCFWITNIKDRKDAYR